MVARRRVVVRRSRGPVWLAGGALVAMAAAVLLAVAPAGAEAAKTTATLTLTGVRDSSCDFSTGGSVVHVKPGGTVTFKAELAGISVKLPLIGAVDLSSTPATSFNFKLVIDGRTKHPHLVTGKKPFVLKNVSAGSHKLAWSANSVTVLGVTVPLNGDTVLPSSLPVGGKLNWIGSLRATNDTKCGVAIEVPGAGVTVGPIHLSLPPIVGPTVTVPDIGGITSHLPGAPGGGAGGSSGSSQAPSGGYTYTPPPTTVPERVVPHPGTGGDSAYLGGSGGTVAPLPDTGGFVAQPLPKVTSTAAAPPTAQPAKAKPATTVEAASTDSFAGSQLPVLLAIVAIIALSLVTATYARMYLLRRG